MIRVLRTPTQPPAADRTADREPTPATPFQVTLRAAGGPATHEAINDGSKDTRASLDPSADAPKRNRKSFDKLLDTSSLAVAGDAAAALAQLAAQSSVAAQATQTAAPATQAASQLATTQPATPATSQLAAPVGSTAATSTTPAATAIRGGAARAASVPAGTGSDALPAAATGALSVATTPSPVAGAGAPSPSPEFQPAPTAGAGALTAPTTGTLPAMPAAATSDASPRTSDTTSTGAGPLDTEDDTLTALGGLATALAHSANTVVAYRVPASDTGTRVAANPVGGASSLDASGRRTPAPAQTTKATADSFAPGPDFASIADPSASAQPARPATTDDTPGVWVAASRAFSALTDRTAASPEVPAGSRPAGFDTTALTPLEQAVHDLLGQFTDEQTIEQPTELRELGTLAPIDPTHDVSDDLTGEPLRGAVDGFSAPRIAAQHTTAATPVNAVREAPEPPTNPSHIHLVVDDGPQRVVVTVAMRGGDVHVAMRSSDDTTTSALARNAASLDHAMRARGLSLGELTAERDPAQHDRPRHHEPPPSQHHHESPPRDRPHQHHEPQERRSPDEPFELEETP